MLRLYTEYDVINQYQVLVVLPVIVNANSLRATYLLSSLSINYYEGNIRMSVTVVAHLLQRSSKVCRCNSDSRAHHYGQCISVLFLLYNYISPWSSVLIEKLIFSQLVGKFLTFYGTRWFIIVFKITRHWSLS